MKNGHLYIISGPSGVGKGTVIKELLRQFPDLYLAISATTRLPREGERDGKDYHFFTQTNFDKMVEDDKLLEYAWVHDHCYGTLSSEVIPRIEQGQSVLLEIDIQGKEKVSQRLGSQCTSIFIVPPNIEILEQRLRTRNTESESRIQGRIQIAKKELAAKEKYDYIVINEQLEAAVQAIAKILNLSVAELKKGNEE